MIRRRNLPHNFKKQPFHEFFFEMVFLAFYDPASLVGVKSDHPSLIRSETECIATFSSSSFIILIQCLATIFYTFFKIG